MGAGIAQVAVEAGFDVVGREVTAELGEQRRRASAHFLTRKVEKGQRSPGGARRRRRAARDDDRPRRPRRLRPRDRGDRRGARRQAGALRRARADLPPRRRPRDEHLRAVRHGDRRRDRRARARRRDALLQPGPADAARRGRPCRALHRRGRRDRARASSSVSARSPVPLPRHARVRRQPRADPAAQRLRPRARRGSCRAGGDRRRDDERRGLADGARARSRPRRDRRPRPCVGGALREAPRAAHGAPAAPRRDAERGLLGRKAGAASTRTTCSPAWLAATRAWPYSRCTGSIGTPRRVATVGTRLPWTTTENRTTTNTIP